MNCPRDGSALQARKREGGVEVDECSVCRGIWLDKGELEALQQASAERRLHIDDPGSNSVERSFNEVEQLATREAPCPRCGTKMTPRDYGFGSQIVIDACPSDCGVWLDVGEVERLQAFYEQSNTDAGGVLPVSFWLRERLYKLFGSRKK